MVQEKRLKLLSIRFWGLYNRVTGSTGNGMRIKEPKPFKPIELEKAFGGAYRSYRINGRSKIDVDTFFNRIGKRLIQLIERELKTQTSARIQTTAWIGSLGMGPLLARAKPMTRRARKELS